MRKSIVTGLILGAGLTVFGGQAQAYPNYPWCVQGDTRGTECYFSTREQCAMDGRSRGFGGQCIQNPFYDPTKGPIIESAAARRAQRGQRLPAR
jgi:Protein of unknown function (DUF3551)